MRRDCLDAVCKLHTFDQLRLWQLVAVLLPARHIKRLMNTIERAVPAPQIEIIVHRALRRQVLRARQPLAARVQDIHDPVHHFAHIDVALVAAALGRWKSGGFCEVAWQERAPNTSVSVTS
jgi:hypothetical protein